METLTAILQARERERERESETEVGGSLLNTRENLILRAFGKSLSREGKESPSLPVSDRAIPFYIVRMNDASDCPR